MISNMDNSATALDRQPSTVNSPRRTLMGIAFVVACIVLPMVAAAQTPLPKVNIALDTARNPGRYPTVSRYFSF